MNESVVRCIANAVLVIAVAFVATVVVVVMLYVIQQRNVKSEKKKMNATCIVRRSQQGPSL